ncbi:hypothetical protein [Mycobacterium conspicuum]|uniref:Uncharacterized protein n=1 Tax=Mycobacterium conspicuum TaxID=44010 RepID=A0A7I7YHK8_9MYCO|nr:hypothetical protein [Mycobacterium conspicuum]BBZ40572.1 hypothetical protein MCNS_36350 [Mycobacterium conspicuum]
MAGLEDIDIANRLGADESAAGESDGQQARPAQAIAAAMVLAYIGEAAQPRRRADHNRAENEETIGGLGGILPPRWGGRN